MSDAFPLVFSITSGKGGVGKTNIAANLAVCLAEEGKRVVLVDADLGLANVDVVLGLAPEKTLFHLFYEGASLRDIVFPTPYGFSILPAPSGVNEMLDLTTGQKLELLDAVDELEDAVDYFIVDTGAGINDNVLYFNLAVQERIVVLTTEPTSLTDAYALIKVLATAHDVTQFRVLVNMAPDKRVAVSIFERLYQACERFLGGVSLEFLGYIPMDASVRKAVIEQKPFTAMLPQAQASTALKNVAQQILRWEVSQNIDGNIKFFWKKLLFH